MSINISDTVRYTFNTLKVSLTMFFVQIGSHLHWWGEILIDREQICWKQITLEKSSRIARPKGHIGLDTLECVDTYTKKLLKVSRAIVDYLRVRKERSIFTWHILGWDKISPKKYQIRKRYGSNFKIWEGHVPPLAPY